jgi:hypothetical protein
VEAWWQLVSSNSRNSSSSSSNKKGGADQTFAYAFMDASNNACIADALPLDFCTAVLMRALRIQVSW